MEWNETNLLKIPLRKEERENEFLVNEFVEWRKWRIWMGEGSESGSVGIFFHVRVISRGEGGKGNHIESSSRAITPNFFPYLLPVLCLPTCFTHEQYASVISTDVRKPFDRINKYTRAFFTRFRCGIEKRREGKERKEGKKERERRREKKEVEKGNSHSTRFMHTPPPRVELFLPRKSATLNLRSIWRMATELVFCCVVFAVLFTRRVFKFTFDLESFFSG